VDDFVAYAKVVFGRYGNKVSHWFTVNEPIVFCDGYPVCLPSPPSKPN
jgi:beta-glucosidase/6-phospho-beta-glucosidase/beta-galactosidase